MGQYMVHYIARTFCALATSVFSIFDLEYRNLHRDRDIITLAVAVSNYNRNGLIRLDLT